MSGNRVSGSYRCPACRADPILIDGFPPTPRFAVFACGSMESCLVGRYRFTQTPDCVAFSEEERERDDPAGTSAKE
jgi:hypothetical protein